jgi:hypothetical protein
MFMAFYYAKYGDWTDKFISLYTWGPFSHTELIFSDNMWFSASMRDKGVRYKYILKIPYFDIKEINFDHWKIVRLNISPVLEFKIRAWCNSQVGKSYDWRGMLSFILPVIKENSNDWYCTELNIQAIERNNKKRYSANSLYKYIGDKYEN